MNRARGSWRLLRTALHVCAGLATILFRFPALSPAQRQDSVHRWSATLLERLGVALQVHGQPQAAGPLMIVANHISWLDISALHAVQYCRFIAKADLKHWPVIGLMSARAGTLFIERESRRDAMRVVHHMADSLRAGDVVAVFPEGTTGDGSTVMPFHANLFQAAISAGAKVQPLLIQYVDVKSGRPSTAASYIGDEVFLTSVWRTLCTPGLAVRIFLGEPQPVKDRHRRTLAAQMRDAVSALSALTTP